MTVTTIADWTRVRPQPSWLTRIFDNKPFLVGMCLLPALGLLTVFLTYPLGLGIWLSFTDTKIGRTRVQSAMVVTVIQKLRRRKRARPETAAPSSSR